MRIRDEVVEEVRAALGSAAGPTLVQVAGMELFYGPSPWCDAPAVLAELEPAEGAGGDAAELRGRLGAEFPDLAARALPAEASPVELVAGLAGALGASLLNAIGGAGVTGGLARRTGGGAWLWIEYRIAAAGIEAMKTALMAVTERAGGAAANSLALTRQIARFRETAFTHHLRQHPIILGAKLADVPMIRFSGRNNMYQLGWGRRSVLGWETSSNEDGLVAGKIAKDKLLTKVLLQDLGVPTPAWAALGPGANVAAAANAVGFPCVVKPADQDCGRGVSTGIRNVQELEQAVAIARGCTSGPVLVEAHEVGEDYRMMVVDGKLVAAVRRDPPMVTGDGTSTVGELLERLNRTRGRWDSGERFLSQVKEDEAFDAHLQRENVTRETVLAEGRRLALRSNANRSTGGTAADVTAKVHPEVRRMMEQVALAMGLRVTGMDYITPDIGRSPAEAGGGIIEVNTTPGLNVLGASGIDLARFTRLLVGDVPGRIPVQLVIADAASRAPLFEHLASALRRPGGAIVGPDRGFVEGRPIAGGSMTPVRLVEAALRHRTVDELTIVWDREHLEGYGMPVDRVDRTILLGAAPSEGWRELIERLSGEVIAAADPGEAARLAGTNKILRTAPVYPGP